MRKSHHLFACIILLYCSFVKPQNNTVDSLKNALKKQQADTTRVNTLYDLAQQLYISDPDTSLGLCKEALSISEKISFKKGIMAGCGWLGYLYQLRGQVKNALTYFHRCLKIQEETKDTDNIPVTLNNIASIHFDQGEYEQALKCWQRGLKLFEKTNNKESMAYTLNNIGFLYNRLKNSDSTLKYYAASLKLREETGDKHGVSESLLNYGGFYSAKKEYATALEYFKKSLAVREELHDKRGIINSLNNIGTMYIALKKFSEAKKYCTKSFVMATELGYPFLIFHAARNMKKIYVHDGNYKKALEMYELSVKMNDSLANEETRKADIKTQLKHDYEKKSAADSVKNVEQQKVKDAQLAAQTASLKQEKFQRYSLGAGLLIVLAGLGFVINRFRVTSKQKKIIEEQKVKVDEAFEKLHEKNKEVMDSIYYARRIQRALITSEKYIEKVLTHIRKK